MIAAILMFFMGSMGASEPLAVMRAGEVQVWRSDQRGWRSIYRCATPIDGAGRLGWAGSQLFIACPGEPLAVWTIGQLGARPVANATLATRRPRVLGSGIAAVYFAERKAVWRYRPGLDLVERIGGAPEWPVRSIAETPLGLVVCGQQRWVWRRGGWTGLKSRSSTGFSQRYQGL